MTTTKKPGPKPMSENMTRLIVRVPQWMLDYLDSKGNRSEVTRRLIEDAKRREDVEAANNETTS